MSTNFDVSLLTRTLDMSKRKRVIKEFIELYKSEPCLWRVKSKEYHDRALKDAAYTKLLIKLKEIEPDAVRDSVVKKINSLRSNVRKMKKRVEASKTSGAPTQHLYKPKLWYYNLFDFLGDHGTHSTSVSNLHDEEGSVSDEDSYLDEASDSHLFSQAAGDVAYSDVESKSKERMHPYSKPNDEMKTTSLNLTDELLLLACEHLKKPEEVEDRYDYLGKMVAMRVRGLEVRQRLTVEKRINDILFEAEMESVMQMGLGSGSVNVSHFMDDQHRSSCSNTSPNLSHCLQPEHRDPCMQPPHTDAPSARPSSPRRFEAISHCGEHPPQGIKGAR